MSLRTLSARPSSFKPPLERTNHRPSNDQSILDARAPDEVMAIVRSNPSLGLVNCATALSRIAKLQAGLTDVTLLVTGDFVEPLTSRTAACFEVEKAATRNVAGCLWACAKLRVAPPELLRAIMSCGLGMRAEWFKPQEISMAVWAVGKLGLGLGGIVGPTSSESPSESDPSLASLSSLSSKFIGMLLPSALSRSSEFDPQGLANVVSGVAAVDVPADSVKSVTMKLQGMLRGRLAEFNPQEVSNALSGLAKLGASLDDCKGESGRKGESGANNP